MIDITNETLVALTEGKKLIPPPNSPTADQLHFWWDTGLVAENGSRIFLETVKIGGRRYTSLQAFHRFVAAQNR